MKRSIARILTTHAGSLPRPSDLLDMVIAREGGEAVDGAKFEARVHSAVSQMVEKQVEAGIDVISDGEMSKPSFNGYVNSRLSGFDGAPREQVPGGFPDVRAFPSLAERLARPTRIVRSQAACTGRVSYIGFADVERDIANFRSALQNAQYEEAFLPAATPGGIAARGNEHYASEEEFILAIADAMKVEYEAIVNAGLLLQLDAPDMALGRSAWYGEKPLSEFRSHLELCVAALNRALSNIRPDSARLHVCWGNWAGPHHFDVPLADIIDILLMAKVGALYIEAFNPRHEHEWTVFEETRLPDGMCLVVGMIDTKTNYIEHPQAIAQRLHRYAHLVGRENLIAGTDCGFGTTADRWTVVPEIAWAKLAALSEGAQLASAQLWK
jgi:5-methyltetrahydropteroyltriglutamate--homocysteine methyltransferase